MVNHLSRLITIVEEQHPLKQGLKHICPFIISSLNRVEEQHPLKQGLKLNMADRLANNAGRSKSNIH